MGVKVLRKHDVLAARQSDYHSLTTVNDMKLVHLGWVYDMNFDATLRRFSESRFLNDLLEFLPRTDEIAAVGRKIRYYVNARIGG